MTGFSSLKSVDSKLAEFGRLAERDVKDHPATCLFQIRKFVDRMTILICLREGLNDWEDKELKERIDDHLRDILPSRVIKALHQLRIEGNKGAHENDDLLGRNRRKNRTAADDPEAARQALREAIDLSEWFRKAYGRSFGRSFARALGWLFLIVLAGAAILFVALLFAYMPEIRVPDFGQYQQAGPRIELRMSVYVPANGRSEVLRFGAPEIVTFDLQNISGIRMRFVENGEIMFDCDSVFNGTPLNGTSYQSFRILRPTGVQFFSCSREPRTVYIYRAWCGEHLC